MGARPPTPITFLHCIPDSLTSGVRPIQTIQKNKRNVQLGGSMAKPFSKFQDTGAAEYVQVTYANTKDATQDELDRVKVTAQPILATARNVAQSTAANVKDVAQNTFTSAKGTTQDKLAKTKDLAQATFRTTRNTTQDRLAKVQKSTKVGLAKTQHLLALGASIALAFLYENMRIALQKMQQAQVSLRQTAT